MARIQTYSEFWDFYLGEHRNFTNRTLHLIGTIGVLVYLAVIFLTGNWRYFPLAFLIGYGFAWVGHLVFEKNKPATFKYPFWSFISDYVMCFYIVTGKIGAEYLRIDHVPNLSEISASERL